MPGLFMKEVISLPLQSMPSFKSTPDKMMEIPQPGIGGLNLKDLEFEQEVNQSPYMLNMMYRNGAFGKRYGQEFMTLTANNEVTPVVFSGQVYDMIDYGGFIFVHAGSKIYRYLPDPDENAENTDVSGSITFPQEKGLFIVFAQKLYFLISSGFYEYDDTNNRFASITPYIPDVMINCKPDGSYSDAFDDFNILGLQFSEIYNGESGVTVYKLYDLDDSNAINWNVTPTVYVDDVQKTAGTDFTYASKEITFNTAPGEGDLNVKIVLTLKASVYSNIKSQILGCKFYETFGGSNNSCLFLAGGGYSKYFWSNAYDITYFPEGNFATLGNTEDDITGFGRQYNVLIIFKPREVYSLYSYTQTSSTTVVEEDYGLEGFRSQLVNARIGCDAPNSIQLINNLLTWFNSKEGVCTLVSTNVQDERNIRTISRNIDHTNNFGVKGILDYNEDPADVQSIDYDNKYFLVFPTEGMCFMWDYEISPYSYSSSGETPPKQLDWFLFDHFYVSQFLKFNKQLIYSNSHSSTDNQTFNTKLVKLTDGFSDINYDDMLDDDEQLLDAVAINSYYMTPFMQFGAVESLKNVKNIYVQCRGDTASVIDMYYYTEENITPEEEPEAIRIGGKLWAKFQWYNFQWLMVNWANTFRRKCNLKKIQMASFYFVNDEFDRDMSITHIGLQYQVVKYVR